MNERGIYEEISKRLDRLDFDRFWPGFRRCPFALYTSEKVFLTDGVIDWDRRFLGNTSINYGGGRIAIWDIGGEVGDLDLLAANMVHEMFHAYQFSRGESRFPRDLVTLGYPQDARNYSMKLYENKLLSRAALAVDLGEKRELLLRFAAVRRARGALIGEYLDCELLSETAEGMAEYVGCLALRALSREKYQARIESYAQNIGEFSAGLFDIRHSSYYSGALFLLTAAEAGLEFSHEIGSTETPVFDLALEGEALPAPGDIAVDPRIEPALEALNKSRRAEYDAFEAAAGERVAGSFYINGYDPMNMSRLGDRVLCTHFISLADREGGESRQLMGKTLLYMEPGSPGLVTGYAR